MPFVTEEVWSWWQDGSVHRAGWPALDELSFGGDPQVLATAGAALSAVRGLKNAHKMSMRAPLDRVVLHAPEQDLDRLGSAERDLVAAGRIADLTVVTDPGCGEYTAEFA